MVSLPPKAFVVSSEDYVYRDIRVHGTILGSDAVMKEAVGFAAEHGVKPVTKTFKLAELDQVIEGHRTGFGGKLVIDLRKYNIISHLIVYPYQTTARLGACASCYLSLARVRGLCRPDAAQSRCKYNDSPAYIPQRSKSSAIGSRCCRTRRLPCRLLRPRWSGGRARLPFNHGGASGRAF